MHLVWDKRIFPRAVRFWKRMMSNKHREEPGIDFLLAYNGLFWTLVSLAEAGWFLFFRRGLWTPPLLIAACAAIFSCAAFAPFLLPARWREKCSARLFVYPLLSLAVLASPLLTWRFHSWSVCGYGLLALVALLRALPKLKAIRRSQVFLLLILVPLISAYLFLLINQTDYANVFAPEQALLGKIRKDTYYASSIAYMIQNYGVPSTGLDGLMRLHYHTGSHTWLAMLGRIAGTPPLFSYPIGLFLILVPAQFFALILAGICAAKNRLKITDYFLVGLALVYVTDATGRPSHYISESFGASLTALLFIFPLMMDLLRKPKPSRLEDTLRIALAIALIYPLSALKISVAILLGASLAYALLRLYGLSLKTAACWILIAGVELFAFRIYNDPGQEAIVAPLKFFASHPRLLFLTSWLTPLLALAAAGLNLGLKNRSDLKAAFRAKTAMDLEIIILVAGLGAIPAILLWLSIAWAWAFFNVVQWMAYPVLFYHLSWQKIRAIKRKTPLLIAALILAAPLIYKSSIHTRSAFRFGYLEKSRQFLDELSAKNTKSPGPPPADLYGPELARLFQDYPGYKAYSLILEAAQGRAKNFAVFVPPENRQFWTIVKNCVAQPMFVPAVTGRMMLMGLTPEDLNCKLEYYGYPDYPREAHSHNLDDQVLCQRARARNISTVFILKDLDRKDQNRILDCETARP